MSSNELETELQSIDPEKFREACITVSQKLGELTRPLTHKPFLRQNEANTNEEALGEFMREKVSAYPDLLDGINTLGSYFSVFTGEIDKPSGDKLRGGAIIFLVVLDEYIKLTR
jgi:hypothetical protein